MRKILIGIYIGVSLAALLLILFSKPPLPSQPPGLVAPFRAFPSVPVEKCGSRREECYMLGSDPGPAYYNQLLELADRHLERQQMLRKVLEEIKDEPAAPHAFEIFFPTISCPKAERVGRFGDGGKWVCEPQKLPEKCTVYSFGGSDDLSFELEMRERYGCETHTFDPSPGLAERMSPRLKESMYYHSIGIGPTGRDDNGKDSYELVIDGVSFPSRSLADISSDLGTAKVEILKLDIEGGELTSIPHFVQDGTLQKLDVQQLLVEFHFPAYNQLASIIDLLAEQGFVSFSREPNARTTLASEYGFVKKAFLLQ